MNFSIEIPDLFLPGCTNYANKVNQIVQLLSSNNICNLLNKGRTFIELKCIIPYLYSRIISLLNTPRKFNYISHRVPFRILFNLENLNI